MAETFGAFLVRRRLEIAAARGKDMKLAEFAEYIRAKADNPLLIVSDDIVSQWCSGGRQPRAEVETVVREALA